MGPHMTGAEDVCRRLVVEWLNGRPYWQKEVIRHRTSLFKVGTAQGFRARTSAQVLGVRYRTGLSGFEDGIQDQKPRSQVGGLRDERIGLQNRCAE